MSKDLTNHHFKVLGKTIDTVLNKGELGNSEYGYILITFPFNKSILNNINFLSNINEEDLHLVLQSSADLLGDGNEFPEKEYFDSGDTN